MNSNVERGITDSKFHRLQKRKRARSVHQENKDTKLASILFLMNWFLITGKQGIPMLTDLINAEVASFPAPELEQIPTDVTYSAGILSLGPNNFLSAAVAFCHDVAREGRMTIVSVGCGDGSIERKIIQAYRARYGEHSDSLNIILVDLDPRYKVHFKYVDELIDKRPDIVGHCAVLIIWPEPQPKNDGYDIEAIRKLQPHGVLTVYESGGGSGSPDFVHFLRDGNECFKLPWTELGMWNQQNIAFDLTEECESHGLDNYEVYDVASRRDYRGELAGTIIRWITIARRMDFEFVNVCPAINWTCKQEEVKFRKFISGREKTGKLAGAYTLANKLLYNMESLGLNWS